MKTILTFPLPHSHAYLTLLYSSLSKSKYHIFQLKETGSAEEKPAAQDNPAYESLRGISTQEFEDQRHVYQSLIVHNRFHAFDIIHFHWIEYIYMPHNTLIGRFGAVFAFIVMTMYMKYIVHNKIVFTFHNVESHNRLNPKLEKLLFKYCIKIAHAVIVHNEYSKKRLLELYDKNSIYEQKISVIPHGNYQSYYPDKITKQEARNKLNIPQNAFVVLVFGEMRKKAKGIEDILSAIENAQDISDPVYYLFAGKSKDIALRNQIEKMCTKHEKDMSCHLSYIPDDEIQIYMNACDVGIVPYRKISTSGSVMLYMSFNKPVIVSNLPPLVELLGDDYPLYCAPADPASITSAIVKAQRMAQSKKSFSFDHIMTCYNWKDIAQKTERVYDLL